MSKPGSEGESLFGCMRCSQSREYFFNGVCDNCFFEIQKEKNSCVCPLEKMDRDRSYYCTLCEEFHGFGYWTMCKECAEKQDVSVQRKKAFVSIGLPSMFVGVIVGFFFGWLFLVKLRKKGRKT